MEELLQRALTTVELGCELIVGLCVAAGAIGALAHLAIGRGFRTLHGMKDVWRRFAGWIVLSLEFALAADIVSTAVAPSWDAIGQLAAIAAIRTALNFFLERDLKEAIESERRAPPEPSVGA